MKSSRETLKAAKEASIATGGGSWPCSGKLVGGALGERAEGKEVEVEGGGGGGRWKEKSFFTG